MTVPDGGCFNPSMGFLDKFKQTVAVSKGGEVDRSAMTPEQLARYDAQMAQVAASMGQGQASYEQGRAVTEAERSKRVLGGPAGEYLYGADWYPPSPQELERIRVEQGMTAMIKASQPPGGLGFTQAVGDALGKKKGPKEVDDPQQRAQIAHAEWTAREAARAPYRAPGVPAVTITRLATRGDSQVDEVVAAFGQSGFAARPDLVWGMYRVPDRISPTVTNHSERGRLVEWDVVHVPAQLPPSPVSAVAVNFPSRQQWVARRLGEPGLLDEDMGRAYLYYAGLGPQDCLGIARFLHLRADGSEDNAAIETWVEGAIVLHRPGGRSAGTMERMTAVTPMALDLGQLPPVHIEILDWSEISRVVQPARQNAPRVPSPIPYLPSTPQELLRAYIEVVGVLPGDCYSAQVTVDRTTSLMSQSGFVSHNLGPKLPCADGKPRARLHGAEQIVVAYQDRAEYAQGRERWATYQRDVLQARLNDASNQRPPIQRYDWDSPTMRALMAPVKALEWLDSNGARKPPPPHRYCWPPVDA